MSEREIRSVEAAVEVPGTPEEVWDAIATGPGIEAWFVPAEVEGREGGAIAYDMGGGMEESARLTAWEPPRRFAGEERWELEGRPPARLATEFLVEAHAGGTCVVRLVTSLFADGGDWDDELESMREGWEMFLGNLRLYLTHFAGRRVARVQAGRPAAGSLAGAWRALGGALGMGAAAEGAQVRAPADAPALAGTVERVLAGAHHRGVVLVLDEPAPGVALVFANAWRGQAYANVCLYLFGDGAAAAARRDGAAWDAWLAERSPAAAGAPA